MVIEGKTIPAHYKEPTTNFSDKFKYFLADPFVPVFYLWGILFFCKWYNSKRYAAAKN